MNAALQGRIHLVGRMFMRAFEEGADTLPQELQLKLTDRFLAFCEARASIRRRMESYVLDYQLHDTGAAHKYERLEEQYAADRPDLNHLVWSEDGPVLWGMRDVAIVLGRNVSSVMRTFRRMEKSPRWGERLNGLTHRSKNPGRGAATLYGGGIFDAHLARCNGLRTIYRNGRSALRPFHYDDRYGESPSPEGKNGDSAPRSAMGDL